MQYNYLIVLHYYPEMAGHTYYYSLAGTKSNYTFLVPDIFFEEVGSEIQIHIEES